jgi:hypothetical protein
MRTPHASGARHSAAEVRLPILVSTALVTCHLKPNCALDDVVGMRCTAVLEPWNTVAKEKPPALRCKRICRHVGREDTRSTKMYRKCDLLLAFDVRVNALNGLVVIRRRFFSDASQVKTFYVSTQAKTFLVIIRRETAAILVSSYVFLMEFWRA